MLAPDVGSEEAGSDREPTHIPTRKKVVRAHVLLAARGPVGDPRPHEEIPGDHEDVDDAEVAHGVSSVRVKWTAELCCATPRDLSSGVREESEAFRRSALRMGA